MLFAEKLCLDHGMERNAEIFEFDWTLTGNAVYRKLFLIFKLSIYYVQFKKLLLKYFYLSLHKDHVLLNLETEEFIKDEFD